MQNGTNKDRMLNDRKKKTIIGERLSGVNTWQRSKLIQWYHCMKWTRNITERVK